MLDKHKPCFLKSSPWNCINKGQKKKTPVGGIPITVSDKQATFPKRHLKQWSVMPPRGHMWSYFSDTKLKSFAAKNLKATKTVNCSYQVRKCLFLRGCWCNSNTVCLHLNHVSRCMCALTVKNRHLRASTRRLNHLSAAFQRKASRRVDLKDRG